MVQPNRHAFLRWTLFAVLVVSTLIVGCEAGSEETPEEAPYCTLIANVGYEYNRPEGLGGASGDRVPVLASTLLEASKEADFIHRRGERLYVYAEQTGMSIVDTSKPSSLHLLEHFETSAPAIQMAVEEEFVYLVVQEREAIEYWGHAPDELAELQEGTGALVVVDSSRPEELTHEVIRIPGVILDARRAADALYVLSYEDGDCEGCGNEPQSRVTAFPLGASKTEAVDRVTLSGVAHGMLTGDGRLYLKFAPDQIRQELFVIDISDPSGEMQLGSRIEATGSVRNWFERDEVLWLVAEGLEARNYKRENRPFGEVDPRVHGAPLPLNPRVRPFNNSL